MRRRSRRRRANQRRRGRSPPKGLVRPLRARRWDGPRIAQLLGAYSHDVGSLLRCLRYYTREEITSLKTAVNAYQRAAPFYKVCSSLFPHIAWPSTLDIFKESDTLAYGSSADPLLQGMAGGSGLHFMHECSFSLSSHGLRLPSENINDNTTCTVNLDLCTQSPSFRGLAAIQSMDVSSAREVMQVKGLVKIGDRIVADTALVGCGIGPRSLAVMCPGDLAGIARSVNQEPTPEFASEFAEVVHLLAVHMVGRKWGDTANRVLSRIMFDQVDEGHEGHETVIEKGGGQSIDQADQSENEFHSQDCEENSESDVECCDARWFAVEHVSREARIAKIIFQYIQGPQELWSFVRYHLGRPEIKILEQGIAIHDRAVDFYEACRTESKLRSIQWIDQVSIGKVNLFVDKELKGLHECSYDCQFVIGSINPIHCSVSIDGKFSNKQSMSTDVIGLDRKTMERKKKNEGKNYFRASLYVEGHTITPMHSKDKLGQNFLLDLVLLNRGILRPVCQHVGHGMEMEIFARQFAALMWEIIKSTGQNHLHFSRLALLNEWKQRDR